MLFIKHTRTNIIRARVLDLLKDEVPRTALEIGQDLIYEKTPGALHAQLRKMCEEYLIHKTKKKLPRWHPRTKQWVEFTTTAYLIGPPPPKQAEWF